MGTKKQMTLRNLAELGNMHLYYLLQLLQVTSKFGEQLALHALWWPATLSPHKCDYHELLVNTVVKKVCTLK